MDATVTADYALRMAERIEWNGRQFYVLAAQAMDQADTRQLLLWLADREADHQRTFTALREKLGEANGPPAEVDEETSRQIQALSTGKFFDAAVRPEQYLSPTDTPREILFTAMGFEKETIVFYEALKPLVAEDEAARTALEAILREELTHLARLAAGLD